MKNTGGGALAAYEVVWHYWGFVYVRKLPIMLVHAHETSLTDVVGKNE